MITLTHNNLNRLTRNLHTNCIALNKKQLKLLAIDWPPMHGWTKELINREISSNLYDELLELRGKGVTQDTFMTKKKMALIREVEKLGGKITWSE